jgi:ribonuclease HI
MAQCGHLAGETLITVFTDGGCRGNGRVDARAGGGAVVVGAGRVHAVSAGVEPGPGLPATNNRAELTGLLLATDLLLDAGVTSPVRLVSDSRICVGTLNTWLPRRLALGTERELANHELVMRVWGGVCELREAGAKVTIEHVRAHQREPPHEGAGARLLRLGNDCADRVATGAIGRDAAPWLREVGGGEAAALLAALAAVD